MGISAKFRRQPTDDGRRQLGRRGAIAIMSAIMAIPLVGLAGIVIDFGFTTMAIERMNVAADAAALVAARTSAVAFGTNARNYIAQGNTAGQSWFAAQAGTTGGLSMGTPTVQVAQNGGIFTATVAFHGAMRTTLGRVFGIDLLPVGGMSTVSISVAGYSDIEIMMDLSSSMGIAATQAGMAALGALTQTSTLVQGNAGLANQGKQPCAFGCHWDANSHDFYGLARSAGIQLRVDVLLGAVQNILATLETKNTNGLFRVGLYSYNTIFQTLYRLNGNIPAAQRIERVATVPVVPLDPVTGGVTGDTNFPLAMTTITNLTQQAGDGTNPFQPQKFVFLITDGVQDYLDANGNRIQGTIDPTACTALKAKGATLMVLYTEYFPIPTNPYYNAFIAPISSAIQSTLQACASPSYFYYATDATSIQTALNQMLTVATASQGRFIH